MSEMTATFIWGAGPAREPVDRAARAATRAQVLRNSPPEWCNPLHSEDGRARRATVLIMNTRRPRSGFAAIRTFLAALAGAPARRRSPAARALDRVPAAAPWPLALLGAAAAGQAAALALRPRRGLIAPDPVAVEEHFSAEDLSRVR